MNPKNIDFEVIKERWGKYNLDDSSILKIKFILTNLKTFQQNEKKQYKANIQNIQVVYADDKLLGEPAPGVFTSEVIQKNIEKDDVGFEALEIPTNEYIIDDGTKLKIFPQVIRIMRSSLKNKFGEPIYMVTTNVTINYHAPKLS